MSRKAGAPYAFRSPLRAPLQARETRSTVCAGRTAGFGSACGLLTFDLTGFPAPAARGAGALPPGWLPVRGRTSGGWGHQRHPAPPKPRINLPRVRLILGAAAGRLAPRCARLPYVTRLSPSDCAPIACAVMARTVARPCEVSRHGCRDNRPWRGMHLPPPESVAHQWRPSPRPVIPQEPAALRALFHPFPCGLRLR